MRVFAIPHFAELPLNGFAEQVTAVKILAGSLTSPSTASEAGNGLGDEEVSLVEAIEEALTKRKFSCIPGSWFPLVTLKVTVD